MARSEIIFAIWKLSVALWVLNSVYSALASIDSAKQHTQPYAPANISSRCLILVYLFLLVTHCSCTSMLYNLGGSV